MYAYGKININSTFRFPSHPRSPITRCQRLSIIMCAILSLMLSSLMFYETRHSNVDTSLTRICIKITVVNIIFFFFYLPGNSRRRRIRKIRVEIKRIRNSDTKWINPSRFDVLRAFMFSVKLIKLIKLNYRRYYLIKIKKKIRRYI